MSAPRPRQARRHTLTVLFAALVPTLITMLVSIGGAPVDAAADEPPVEAWPDELLAGTLDGDDARELAARHRPVIMLKAQSEPCDTEGEAWWPTSVEIVLGNSEVLLRQAGHDDPVVMRAPAAADLHRGSEGLYLDFPGLALEPGCTYQRDFDRFAADVPVTVYARVAKQADRPDRVVVQYWTYWYFNRWNNVHESDWEGIQLVFDATTPAEALEREPIGVAYAQHEGGESSAWDADKLELEGQRPVVYSSAGSHASYYQPAVYLGRRGTEGFGCDVTTGPSLRLNPAMVLLPASVGGPDDPMAWLTYAGRWGERNSGANNGPTGPLFKDRWSAPMDWYDETRSASVVVPGDDGPSAALVEAFCDVTAAGSAWLTRIQLDPAALLIPLAVLALAVWLLARRTDWSRTEPLPLQRRRSAGQILRGALTLAQSQWPAYGVIGLVYVPVAVLLAAVMAIANRIPGVGTLLELGDDTTGLSAVLAVFVGAISTTFAFSVVIGAVTRLLDEAPATDTGLSARERADAGWRAVRATLARWRPLVGALMLASLTVTLLLFSVVGIPIAILLAVRFQFIAGGVTVRDYGPLTALRRSSALVRGRWWSTAAVIGVIVLVVLGVSTGVSLLILVGATGLPLWVFPAVSMVITAIVAPVAAGAHALLYGSRAAGPPHAGAADTSLL